MKFDPSKVIKGATDLPDGKYYYSDDIEEIKAEVNMGDPYVYSEQITDNMMGAPFGPNQKVSDWKYFYPIEEED